MHVGLCIYMEENVIFIETLDNQIREWLFNKSIYVSSLLLARRVSYATKKYLVNNRSVQVFNCWWNIFLSNNIAISGVIHSVVYLLPGRHPLRWMVFPTRFKIFQFLSYCNKGKRHCCYYCLLLLLSHREQQQHCCRYHFHPHPHYQAHKRL